MANISEIRAIVERSRDVYLGSLRSAGALLRVVAHDPAQADAVAKVDALARDVPSLLAESVVGPTTVATSAADLEPDVGVWGN